MNLRSFSSISDRRKAIEEVSGITIHHVGHFSLDETIASTKNCENMIGVTQVPLGVAGPLVVKQQHQQVESRSYLVPLATTEGALVASINRGCKVISESGGAFVAVERVGITRGPVFKTASLSESFALKKWIEQHDKEITDTAEKTSSHLTLISTVIQIVGDLVYVRFSFDTQDAMGMNMATIAVQSIAVLIEKETKNKCLAVSGNFCVDKKPSWQNIINGRGFRAWSEVVIPTNILTTILKVTEGVLIEAWEAKCLIGSALTGSLGYNGHAANVVGALYLATGQDIAHTVEGSSVFTTMKKHDDGIAVSVYMPSVLVGTVGGGTALATQKEALELLGVAGGNEGKNSTHLAGIIASTVLAGEISELAALATGSLTQAHQRLGRGRES